MKNKLCILAASRLSPNQSALVLGGTGGTVGQTEPTNGGGTTNPEGDPIPKRPMPEPDPDF